MLTKPVRTFAQRCFAAADSFTLCPGARKFDLKDLPTRPKRLNARTHPKLMKTSNLLVAFVAVSTLCFNSRLVCAADAAHDTAHADAWASVKQAVAVLHPTVGNKCQGTVKFTQDGSAVKVVAD